MDRRGVLWISLAYVGWGLSPLFWKQLTDVPALEVFSFRTIFSAVCLAPLLLTKGTRQELATIWKDHRKSLLWLPLTSFLIVANWYFFVSAMLTNQVIQSSLAYFLNPLLNVLCGLVILRERINRTQALAILIATLGVLYFIVQSSAWPTMALFLAASFAIYGLVRKQIPVSGTTGIFLETILASPVVYFLFLHGKALDYSAVQWTWISLSGPITAGLLIWYVWGVQKIPLSTAGFLMFSSPILQFLLAVLWYGEPFPQTMQVTFGLIWIGLALYCRDLYLRTQRAVTSPTKH